MKLRGIWQNFGDAPIDKDENARDKIPGSNDYEKIYSIPTKGTVTNYRYVGKTKDGKVEEIQSLVNMKGISPLEEVIIIDQKGEKIETRTLSNLYDIKGTGGNELLGVRNDGGYQELLYVRRTPGNVYVALPIPQANTRDVDTASMEAREMISTNVNTGEDLDELAIKYYKIEGLEKQGVPDEINPEYSDGGIGVKEITRDDAKLQMIEGLQKEYRCTLEEAKEITQEVMDEGRDFEETFSRVKEEEQKTPWGDAMGRRGR